LFLATRQPRSACDDITMCTIDWVPAETHETGQFRCDTAVTRVAMPAEWQGSSTMPKLVRVPTAVAGVQLILHKSFPNFVKVRGQYQAVPKNEPQAVSNHISSGDHSLQLHLGVAAESCTLPCDGNETGLVNAFPLLRPLSAHADIPTASSSLQCCWASLSAASGPGYPRMLHSVFSTRNRTSPHVLWSHPSPLPYLTRTQNTVSSLNAYRHTLDRYTDLCPHFSDTGSCSTAPKT
jgi:hypothetical protein